MPIELKLVLLEDLIGYFAINTNTADIQKFADTINIVLKKHVDFYNMLTIIHTDKHFLKLARDINKYNKTLKIGRLQRQFKKYECLSYFKDIKAIDIFIKNNLDKNNMLSTLSTTTKSDIKNRVLPALILDLYVIFNLTKFCTRLKIFQKDPNPQNTKSLINTKIKKYTGTDDPDKISQFQKLCWLVIKEKMGIRIGKGTVKEQIMKAIHMQEEKTLTTNINFTDSMCHIPDILRKL